MALNRESGETPVLPRPDGAANGPKPRHDGAASGPKPLAASRPDALRDGSEPTSLLRAPQGGKITEARPPTRLLPPPSPQEKKLTGWQRLRRFMRPPRKLKVT